MDTESDEIVCVDHKGDFHHIKPPIVTQLLNPIFYCDCDSVGVEINGEKYEAQDNFYRMIDEERQNLKNANHNLSLEVTRLSSILSQINRYSRLLKES